MEPQHARTKSTQSNSDPAGCVVCGDRKHERKLYVCKQFQMLTIAEKKAAVRMLGACRRCLEVHDDSSNVRSKEGSSNTDKKEKQRSSK